MEVVFLVLFVLIAFGLVLVLGLPLGMFIWLCIYGLFRLSARALLVHVGDDTDVPTGRSTTRISAPTNPPDPPLSHRARSSLRRQ